MTLKLKNLKTNIKNRLTRKKGRVEKKNKNQSKIVCLASSLPPLTGYMNFDGQCIPMNMLDSVPNEHIEMFYKDMFPSFQSFEATDKILINQDDFKNLITGHETYVQDVARLSNRPREQVMIDFANYHGKKEFLIQPAGFSGIIYKVSNLAYVCGSTASTCVTVGASHLSKVTGLGLLGANPTMAISVPLAGGVFFAGCERLLANTWLQPGCIVARDICLIPPKLAEVFYNGMFPGPFLNWLGIDAPLNVTSVLQFGAGTKIVLGTAVNGTLSAIRSASPENIIEIYKAASKVFKTP